MKVYFEDILNEAKQHAISEYPKECCGLVVNDTYIPCNNYLPDLDSGKLDVADYIAAENLGEIQAFIHSHNNFPHASKADMIEQLHTDIPWGIINVQNGAVQDIFFWGDTLPIQDYIGRPFYHGVYDCWAMVRDWYRGELGIVLPMFPREYGWWKNDEDLILNNFVELGWTNIGNDLNDLQPNDGIVMKVNSRVVNHTGIYIGDGLLLHHLCFNKNSLSRREPLNVYRNNVYCIMRYNK